MNHHILTFVVILKVVSCQDTTTEGNHHTVTYNPGQDCLPYDGSVVPDCRKYVDPITKQPYFKEHSSNCSRFWMCGPDGETCLVECAHCGGPSNSLCNGQWALTFDPSYQYPLGPVCDWPSNIECGVVCNLDEHECCHNEDCNKCPDGYCAMDFNCIYDGPCECTSDSDCDNSDGLCNVPAPHDPSSCTYCDGGKCEGGCSAVGGDSVNCPDSHPTCSTDHVCGCGESPECDMFDGVCDMTDTSDPYNGHCYYCDATASQCKPGCGGLENNANCPDNYQCNLDTHECELSVCDDHPFCDGYDEVCSWPAHDNCYFCGGDCGSDNGCCQGCHDSALNCAYPAPVCDDVTHTCGCKEDSDCNAEDWCNTDTGLCEPDCQDHDQCLGYDEVCNSAHDNCYFCGGDCGSNDGCCQGCHDDELNCVYPTPVCDQSSHTCGCNDDGDCNAEDFCNTDTNTCEPQCVQDTECEGFDQVCNDAYNNCFFCGDCDGFGCCPGCHDSDLNCVYPKPICQGDHKCGCDSDDDCKAGDQCDEDSNSCVEIPDECATDADCNTGEISGVCDAAVAVQTQCFYCDNSGLFNVCKPGCMYDSDSSEVPRCPVNEPICNIDTHFCQAQAGIQLLMKMVFTSASCEGCSSEGVNLTLTGSDNLLPEPVCRTVDLDHPDQVDYVSRSEFNAQPAEQDMGWDSCYQRGMAGEITAATATWTGEGTWSPNNICFDWDKENNRVSVCTFPAGTSLSNGQSATLACVLGDVTECP